MANGGRLGNADSAIQRALKHASTTSTTTTTSSSPPSYMLFSGRPVQSSPSVAIEKGGYRLRDRRSRLRINTDARVRAHTPSKLRSTSTPSITAETAIRYERRMISLLIAAAVAAAACFGMAWWLLVNGRRVLHRLP
ncbi:hypothetical protein OF83DRAFT_1174924 [Amylostereum chailletii]|nr:hypothetical protein OF83DRAFT_1174924 [Amylostereum chailletii]